MTGMDFVSLGARQEVRRAPKWPALSAAAVAIFAIGAAVTASTTLTGNSDFVTVVAGVGYVFGCLGAIIFASTHRALRDKERRNPAFRLDPWLDTWARVSIVVGLVAGLWCAFLVATELAR